MLAGHIGAGLALASAERRVNVGIFVVAGMFLDLVLWVFILLGWESAAIPQDFTRTHQPDFRFPYSHGLVAAVLWAMGFAAALAAWASLPSLKRRLALLLVAAVFSHWLLDALVHRPELPLFGDGSPRLGLGLWNHMPLALVAESLVVLAGLWLFLAGSGWSRARCATLAALVLATLVFTVLGMLFAPPPPSVAAMAGSSLAMLVLVCALCAWIGRAAGRA